MSDNEEPSTSENGSKKRVTRSTAKSQPKKQNTGNANTGSTGSNHTDNEPLEMQHSQAFGKVSTHTIVVSGTTYIGHTYNGTDHNRWFLFPWHLMSTWLNDEQAWELRSKYRYWKMAKLEVAFKNPMCTHEIVQGNGQSIAQNSVQANIFGYLDEDYLTGVTHDFSPYNGATAENFYDMHNTFRNNGIKNGTPQYLPYSQPSPTTGVHIAETMFTPTHPNVTQMACGNGKQMSFAWSAFDPYWRVTNEFALNPAYVSGNNHEVYHEGASTYGRWDQACGTINRNFVTGENDSAYAENKMATLCPWMGTNRDLWYNQHALTQPELGRGHYAWVITNNTEDIRQDTVLSQMNIYRTPNPVPNIWLTSEALLGSVTTGVANSAVRLQFEFRVTLLVKGRIPRQLQHRATYTGNTNAASSYGMGSVATLSRPVFIPIVPFAMRWHTHQYNITPPAMAVAHEVNGAARNNYASASAPQGETDDVDGAKTKLAKSAVKVVGKIAEVLIDVLGDNQTTPE